nr:integrase, catalytic region, zinc finger, CCHC-type, peptidase aspartic, catalytic [Tanacetum cinerariifolium]
TRETKCTIKQSVAKPIRKTVDSESNQKPRNITRKLYEHVRKACSWWYPKFTPSGYKWKRKSEKENVNPNLVEIVLLIVDSGCSKRMTGNLKLLINFVEKFLGTVKFGNDQIVHILGYEDLVKDYIMGQDRQMQMVRGNGENQFRQYAGQNLGNLNGYNAVQNVKNQVAQNPRVQNVRYQNRLIGVLGNANQNRNGNANQNRNGNLVATHAEGNAAGHNGNHIRCYNCRGNGHLARNCTIRPRRKDAAYLQTQLLITQKEEAGI